MRSRDFPRSQIRSRFTPLVSLSPREKAPAIPPSRVPRCFLLTGPHTSTARSSEPSVPSSPRSPALPRIPPQATGRFRLLRCCCPLPTLASESVSTRYRALRASGWLAVTVPDHPPSFNCAASEPLLPQRHQQILRSRSLSQLTTVLWQNLAPTQWKRQFLNFFGCPGAAAPSLPGLSRRVASRRPRKLTAPAALAFRSRKSALPLLRLLAFRFWRAVQNHTTPSPQTQQHSLTRSGHRPTA